MNHNNLLLKNFKSNITNFYQQKKRVFGNDSFKDDDPAIKSPVKKQLRKAEEIDSPIIWETKNTSVDCQLKVFDGQEDSVISTSSNNESKIDQMLDEFRAKLQFEAKNKNNPSNATEQLDEDHWFDKFLKSDELEKFSQNSQISKESGIGSCDSYELQKKSKVKIDLNKEEDKFKIPETPVKSSKSSTLDSSKFYSSNKFSTPKVFSKKNKISNQLFIENLSPIKFVTTPIKKIETQTKTNNDNTKKKKNLFNSIKNSENQIDTKKDKNENKDLNVKTNDTPVEFEDDSLEKIYKELDDDYILQAKEINFTDRTKKTESVSASFQFDDDDSIIFASETFIKNILEKIKKIKLKILLYGMKKVIVFVLKLFKKKIL